MFLSLSNLCSSFNCFSFNLNWSASSSFFSFSNLNFSFSAFSIASNFNLLFSSNLNDLNSCIFSSIFWKNFAINLSTAKKSILNLKLNFDLMLSSSLTALEIKLSDFFFNDFIKIIFFGLILDLCLFLIFFLFFFLIFFLFIYFFSFFFHWNYSSIYQ